MPRPAALLTTEHFAWATERYLLGDAPRDVAAGLKKHFGVDVRVSALRQKLTRSGVCKRRKEVDAKVCRTVSAAKVEGIARVRAAEPAKLMSEWGERVVRVTDKALDMAEAADKPRDLASAVNAASSSIRIYRAMVGLDGPDSAAGRAATARYDFNFQAFRPTKIRTVTPEAVVEVSCDPVAPAAPAAAPPEPRQPDAPAAKTTPPGSS